MYVLLILGCILECNRNKDDKEVSFKMSKNEETVLQKDLQEMLQPLGCGFTCWDCKDPQGNNTRCCGIQCTGKPIQIKKFEASSLKPSLKGNEMSLARASAMSCQYHLVCLKGLNTYDGCTDSWVACQYAKSELERNGYTCSCNWW